MKKILPLLAIIAALIIAAFVLATLDSDKKTEAGKILVAVSVLPQEWLVEQIGGDRVSVVTMIPSGASPHTYEPTPEQMRAFATAKIYVKVGHPLFDFEKNWFDKLLSENKDIMVVDITPYFSELPETPAKSVCEHCQNGEEHHHHDGESEEEGIEFLREDEEKPSLIPSDPHVWLGIDEMIIMAQAVTAALIKIDRSGDMFYLSNFKELIKKIESLEERLSSILDGVENRKFMVHHPAWGYFARKFNLEQIAIEQHNREPGPLEIKELVEQAKREGVKVIFIQDQFDPRNAKVIADEIGGKVVKLDPLAKNWLENMQKAAEAFAETLK